MKRFYLIIGLILLSNILIARQLPINESISFLKNSLRSDQILITNSNYNIYISPHFQIYYGNEIPALDLWNDLNENKIPDFIETLAEILEEVWFKEVEELGLGFPYGNLPISVFVANTGLEINYFPLELPDYICGFSTINGGNSYIIVNAIPPSNPYSTALDMLKITIAHEFFHLIQFSYKIDTNPYNLWLYEGTATLVERLVYREIQDYVYTYVPTFLKNPNRGLLYYEDPLHPYSTVLFFDYLVNKYSLNIITTIWNNFKFYTSALEAVAKSIPSFEQTLFDFYLNISQQNFQYFTHSELLKELISKGFIKIPYESTKYMTVNLSVYPTGAFFIQANLCLDLFNPNAQIFIINPYNLTLEKVIWLRNFCFSKEIPIVIYPNTFTNPLLNETKLYYYLYNYNPEYSLISLRSGWNLINFKKFIKDVEDFFKNFQIYIAWLWRDNQWYIYTSDTNLKQLLEKYKIPQIVDIKPYEGIWILIKTDEKIFIEKTLDTHIEVFPDIKTGWNLLSNPSYVDLSFKEFTGVYNGTQIIWIWNASLQQWHVYIPEYKQELKDLIKKYQIPTIDKIPGYEYNAFWLLNQ